MLEIRFIVWNESNTTDDLDGENKIWIWNEKEMWKYFRQWYAASFVLKIICANESVLSCKIWIWITFKCPSHIFENDRRLTRKQR